MSTAGYRPFLQCLLLLGLFQAQTSAQVIGEDLCACSPSVYRFTLDFTVDLDQVCPPANITIGGGVASAECLIRPFSNPAVTDLVPVSVTQIDVFEYGQDVTLIVSEKIEGDFLQGDTFDYESITFTPEEITSAMDIPRVFQLSLRGPNADGEEIVNISVITMTNNCEAFPVFDVGASAGWATFSGFEDPDEGLCPLVTGSFPPTDSPSTTPSSMAPTILPSPTTSAPTAPEPTTSAPTMVSPVNSSAPSAPEPTPSSPVTTEPTAAPTTAPPVTGAPVTESPVTSNPSTPEPTTSSPVTSAPATESPVTGSPVTESPATAAPAAPAPTTPSPVTSAPTPVPTMGSPITGAPVTSAPVTSSPITSAPPVTPAPATAAPADTPVATPTPAPTLRGTGQPTLRPTNPSPPTFAPPTDMSMSMSMNLRGLRDDLDEILENEFGQGV